VAHLISPETGSTFGSDALAERACRADSPEGDADHSDDGRGPGCVAADAVVRGERFTDLADEGLRIVALGREDSR
jgi:hypothetical protein